MNKNDCILAALSASGNYAYSPVQIQKLLFLIDKRLGHLIEGPFFDFVPYHYGPFDHGIYSDLTELNKENMIEIIPVPSLTWNKYKLTAEGLEKGKEILNHLDSSLSDYIQALNQFVIKLSFPQLLASIYKAYPEMAINSVLQ